MMRRSPKVSSLLHGVGHHQGGQFVAPDNRIGQRNHLVGTFGIERSGVLVEKQQIRVQAKLP